MTGGKDKEGEKNKVTLNKFVYSVYFKSFGSSRVPMSKVQAYTVLDPYGTPSLPLSLSIPLSLSLWGLSHRNVSIPKHSKKDEVAGVSVYVCACLCVFVCVCLPASVYISECVWVYVKMENTSEKELCMCVCAFIDQVSPPSLVIEDSSRPSALLYITHCLHAHTYTQWLSLCPFPLSNGR